MHKLKIIGSILSVLFLLAACGGERQDAAIPLPANASQKTINLVTQALPSLRDKCPGFKKYGYVLEFEDLQEGAVYYPSSNKETTVTWILLKVPDDDKVIPAKYRAWGHTLYLGFEENGKSIILKKSTTQMVFLDTDAVPSGKDMIL